MVRMDHGLQTGGRASLACGGLQVQSAPWPREACVSLIPNSVSLCRWAGGAPTIRMFRWVPCLALTVVRPSSKHTEFPQKEGHVLSTRAAPQTACPGVAAAQRSQLFLI